MLDLTKYPHMQPREVSTLEATNQPKPRQEGWYYPDERDNGRYRNEMMNLLSEALKANNLEPVNDYITEYLAHGPLWGATARTIHTLAPTMNDAIVADNAPYAKKLLERGANVSIDAKWASRTAMSYIVEGASLDWTTTCSTTRAISSTFTRAACSTTP